jgi:carboxymethylenebutenolidase
MSEQEISFVRMGTTLRGHLASPATRAASSTPAPGLLLVPDVHGLSDLYREIASRFAARGFETLAVDLYSREGAPKLGSPAEAMAWIARLPDDRILGDLQAAVDHLASRGAPSRPIGITGFCMGGQYALLAACSLTGLSACVSFYGMVRYPERNPTKPRSPLDAAADLTCPYLGIFGEDDALIPMSDVDELEKRLAAAGKVFTVRRYPGCGHAFLNHTRPDAYRPDAARDAFEEAARLFTRHLSRPA